jgi:hypothetical protein
MGIVPMIRRLALVLAAIGGLALPAAAAPGAAPTYTAWAPIGRAALSAGATTGNVQLGGGAVAYVCNDSATVDAFLAFGTDNTVAATVAGSYRLRAGVCKSFELNPVPGTFYSWLAGITTSGTASLYVETGIGSVGPSISQVGLSPSTGAGIPTTGDSAYESGHIFCASGCSLFGLGVTIQAVSGWLVVVDSATVPADGAIASYIGCWHITSDGTSGGAYLSWGSVPSGPTSNGLSVYFSTNAGGCTSKTASATASFKAQVK